ncbi:MAG: MarR family transcriptional regulator [Candidatus Bipolaricaulota bacterium]|nr:MAG: MarR family transcriptional regulator [Candidatus Bipolaricaulota bacterium]
MSTHEQDRQRYIEMAGDMLEEHGLPHMAGRVLGALQICVPLEMTMTELAKRLRASKGSISTATRLLLRLELVEKVSVPGQRAHAYRMRPNVFSEMFAQRTEHLSRHHRLGELGLGILREESIEMKQRVVEMQAFFDFVSEELPRLIERWRERRPLLLKRRLAGD